MGDKTDMTTEELKRLAENIMPGPWKITDFWGSGTLDVCPDYPHPSGGEWADIAQVNDLGDTYDDASQYPNTPVLAQAHARAIALVPDLLRELIERREADAPVTAREAVPSALRYVPTVTTDNCITPHQPIETVAETAEIDRLTEELAGWKQAARQMEAEGGKMQNDAKLLPCPFCGGSADISHDHTVEENHAYGCRACDIWFDGANSDDPVAAWNTRTPHHVPVTAQEADPVAWQVRYHSRWVMAPSCWTDEDRANWPGEHRALYTHPPQSSKKVREGMQRVIDRLRHEGQINPSLTYADAIEWAEYVLNEMETLK